MPAKKTTKKTKRRSNSRRSAPQPILSPEAKREISAVFLGAMALLLGFGALNFGGTLVTQMFEGLKVVVGYSAYVLPLVFGSLAWMLFQPSRYSVRGVNYFG